MDVKLSLLKSDDIEMVREWRNSPEVSKYMYTDGLISVEDQKRWFDKISIDKTSKYFIIEYDDCKIGLASIYNIDEKFQSCSWAFYIGNSEIRGAGIGSKVEYNILQFVFDELKLNKLCCEVFSFNEAVIKMHEKLGFRREGYYREHILKNEKYYDIVALAILKKEWDIVKPYLYNSIYNR